MSCSSIADVCSGSPQQSCAWALKCLLCGNCFSCILDIQGKPKVKPFEVSKLPVPSLAASNLPFGYSSLPGAWALKKSWTRPLLFLYFREIRKKRSHWPGGQSDLRLYNSYNLCPLARPAHVGEYGPTAQAQVQVLKKKKGSWMIVLRYTTLSARESYWRNPRKKIIESTAI